MKINKFPFFKQLDAMDCGPASLKIICRYYGKHFSMKYLRDECHITKEGVSLKDLSRVAEAVGLRSLPLKVTLNDLQQKIPLRSHFTPIAEQHFSGSSEVVLGLIREHYDHWDYPLAMGLALQMQVLFAQAVFANSQQLAVFFQFYFRNWLPSSLKIEVDGSIREETLASTMDHYEHSFREQKDQIAGIISPLRQTEQLENWQSSWSAYCENFKLAIDAALRVRPCAIPPKFQPLDDIPLNRSKQFIWSIFESLVHMTNNRLGIDLRDEAFLAYLLAKSLTESPAPEAT